MPRICLITPHHVSFQPRTLREADALQGAGHEVRVVSRQTDPLLKEYDEGLMRTRNWRLDTIDLCRNGRSRGAWLLESLRSEASRKLFKVGLETETIALTGYLKGLDRLKTFASRERADWFIAHTQAALPVAVAAARRWNAKIGFDCEDLLIGRGTDPLEIVRLIESKYISFCNYVSVPSEQIAHRISKDYEIDTPLILYNTLPLYLAAMLVPPRERAMRSRLRLYWFGQTLGPGRGIEEAVIALGLLMGDAELHLRGQVSKKYHVALEDLARKHGVAGKVTYHPLVGPDDLIQTLGQFDVGLALESPENPSTSQTVSNKLFSYLLAGLAIAATDTPGQREVLEKIPSAGFLYPAGNPKVLAERLRRWIDNPESLRFAQQAAWDAARARFCWDIEKEKFLALFQENPRPHLSTVTEKIAIS